MNTPTVSYKRHRFPPQIIAHAVWPYFRFPLSLIARKSATLHLDLLSPSQSIRPARSQRSALAIHIHRLQAMAEWKAAIGKLA
jgi:hypothetical protein